MHCGLARLQPGYVDGLSFIGSRCSASQKGQPITTKLGCGAVHQQIASKPFADVNFRTSIVASEVEFV